MNGQAQAPKALRLDPEKVAYWYFRLNGFLTIENFVVHDYRGRGHRGTGSQRTDADLLGVRFPHRSECAVENPNAPMLDDVNALGLSAGLIEVVIAEIKAPTKPCELNGPWTEPSSENIQRVLAAIGCVPPERIEEAASALYTVGCWRLEGDLRIKLITVGGAANGKLAAEMPNVVQMTWSQLVGFIHDRLNEYRVAKSHSPQWDACGTRLRELARRTRSRDRYVHDVLEAMRLYTVSRNNLGVSPSQVGQGPRDRSA